jgi:hypothetical protein
MHLALGDISQGMDDFQPCFSALFLSYFLQPCHRQLDHGLHHALKLRMFLRQEDQVGIQQFVISRFVREREERFSEAGGRFEVGGLHGT